MFPSHETVLLDGQIIILFYVKTTYQKFRESAIFLSSTDSLQNILRLIQYTILIRSEDIANKLRLRYVKVVFDATVYAKPKIQHVRWKNEAFQHRFVVRLGEFHTTIILQETRL